MGGWGRWAPGPRELPARLEGLRAVGAAGNADALLTPLPTFRSAPKGARQQLGDFFADLGEVVGFPHAQR